MADKTSPLLIGQKGELPEKKRYTTVSVTQGYTEQLFNGVAGMTTRKIRICGVKLIWDEDENTNSIENPDEVTAKLFNYSGSNDIESLEMYADEIVIRSPLVFPQTDLWICARKLIFEGKGSITTTPSPHPPCYTKPRDGSGRPLNERGKIEAKSGLNGARGGHITLCLPEGASIAIPASDMTRMRFITVGGKGQDAEGGGYLDYASEANQRKIPGDQTLGGALGSWYVENLPQDEFSKYVGGYDASDWQWPDRWKTTFDNSYSVMHARVEVIAQDPEGTRKSLWKEVGERIWPGGVPDAFPSGKSGDGGAGGDVRRFWGIPNEESSMALIRTILGGEPGASPEIKSRCPSIATDSGRPPVFVRMKLAHKASDEFPQTPSLDVEKCPFPIISKGAISRPGKQGLSGRSESVSHELTQQTGPTTPEQRSVVLQRHPNGWPNHLVIEPALQYARDAYLNGYRDEPREMLECYRDVIEWVPENARSAALVGQATEISALLTQLKENLDYYGNPPGWLPRLSMLSSLQLFLEDQKNAVSLLYFAYKLEKSWAQVQDHATYLKSTRKALSQAVQLAKQNYAEGLALLESSRTELDSVQGQAKEIGRQIKALDELITSKAVNQAKDQAILAGICSIASGLCKVIPLGQPYLGAAGDAVFQPLAKIDLSNPNAAEEAFKFAEGIGDGLTTFVNDNRDAVLKDSEASFTKKLTRIEGNLTTTEKKITEINEKIEKDFDSKVSAHVANLETEITSLETEAKTITDAAKKNEQQAKALSFKEELALYKSRKLDEAVVKLRQQIADADKNALTKAERDAKDGLLKEMAALQARKELDTKNSANLKEKQEEQQKLLDETMTHAARIGKGVSTLASGLTKLVVPVDRHSSDVEEIKKKIAESAQYKAQFQGLMDSLDKLGIQKAQLIEGVERAQHILAESCATMSKSLLQSADVSRQMQTMGNALDLEVKLYARALRQRSEERLRKSLYHVVKSYEYHTLSRVPPDFFRTDVIKKIVALEESKLAAGQLDTTLTVDDFRQIYETVFRDKFLELSKQITDALQHVKPSKKNRYLCALKPAQLTQLNDTWRLTFKIVEDFGKTSGNPSDLIDARIVGIALKRLEIATADNGLSLDIDFTHSGKHLITDPAGFQYFFQIGKYEATAQDQDGNSTKKWVSDQPIAWRSVYNAGGVPEAVTLDERVEDDQIVQYLLREFKAGAESEATTLQEHRPAFTSEITLTLDGGLDITAKNYVTKKKAKAFEIIALEFWVFFQRR